ncbi:MAG: cytidine deaminase [Lachnospiraceae bacterium]|nr:cytidine deaminase [Lachnospiraceae bacterium]MDY5742884.1 cytidine deaminase [Lachnospiraceae bacterium]
MTDIELLELAREARSSSYTPYSNFRVGAALLTKEGKVYRGCNIENAAYGPTNCAERTAFFTAVCAGEREFAAIAIAGGKEGTDGQECCAPCGVCRQVMMEFCRPDEFRIILADGNGGCRSYRLEELLPMGFGPQDLT